MGVAVNWGLVFVGSVVAGVSGFYVARAQYWWHGMMRGSRHLFPVLRYGATAVIVLVLLGTMAVKGWW